MGVPKGKTSKSNKRQRRGEDKLRIPDCLLVLNATASSGLIKPVLNVVTIKGKR